MSKKILLISEKQIKDQSIIEQNVDSKILSKVIQNVQEIQLKAVLGSTLYSALLSSVEADIVDAVGIPQEYRTLLDEYIQPFLIHAVLVDFIVVNNYKVTNKGLLKMRDDVADAISSDELEYTKSYYEGYKSEYKKNLIVYLKENKLVSYGTDTDVTTDSTGWFLD